MATDDELLEQARRLVAQVADQTVGRAPTTQQARIRQYFDVRGGLFRQLARRVLRAAQNQLREPDAIDWALRDLERAVLAMSQTEESKRQFARWFVERNKLLLGLAADFWKVAATLTVHASDPRAALGLTLALLTAYLTHPLASEFDSRARTDANLQAILLLASGVPITTEAQRLVLAGYTGWGGLSIERVADRIPRGWQPSSEALIHEYYTPPLLCFEVARVMRPLVARLGGKEVRALEPSAGIGRFVHALSLEGFERVRWTAVEYSHVSAQILRHLRPDCQVVQGSFESFVQREEAALSGKLHLVVTNPPYGERGGTMAEDKSPAYRLRDAYPYFVFRSADLLAPLGYGAFVIPYGFLSGRNPELSGHRKRLLSRHHLLAAFRLPSSLFPGASIVTDLLIIQSRGQTLAEIPSEDLPLVEGRYFELFPSHILGKEIRSGDDDAPKRARFGYEVLGTFTRLPDFTVRPLCSDCSVEAAPAARATTPRSKGPSELPIFLLPEEIQTAIALGDRVSKYLGLLSSSSADALEKATRQHPELLEALESYRKLVGGPPRQSRALIEHRFRSQVVSLLSAFDDSGEVVKQLRAAPAYRPSLSADEKGVAGHASFLYRTERAVSLERLASFRRAMGQTDNDLSTLRTALVAAKWCVDGREWLPEDDYYSGFLWPRYDRAVALTQSNGDATERAVGAVQARRLLELIDPVPLSVIEPDPRLNWVPLAVQRTWLTAFTGVETPELERRNHHVIPKRMALVDLAHQGLSPELVVAIGFLNFDYALFRIPNAPREIDTATGKEESESSSQNRARVNYEKQANEHFRAFLRENPADGELVTEAYNRAFRGWVEPSYRSFVMPARWGSRIELRAHQKAGAARLLYHLGGLLAFDVGVGKTFTGLATLARLREEGKAKRPVVVVPNSIVWQWYKAAQSAVPGARVLVVGAERYIGRSGTLVSRTDKPEERALKWRLFQAGAADLVICTYTTFAKAATRPESREAFAWNSPPLLRLLGLEARDAELDATEQEDDKKKKPKRKASKAKIVKQFGESMGLSAEEIEKAAETAALNLEREREAERERIRKLIASLSTYSERERAILQHRIARWASLTAEREDADPGIYWEDLGIDALFVDEAQNFKNLWPVILRPNQEMPKYLGGIDRASQRAMEMAVRAFLVRQKNGGSGVYLLSATPAKNSPLEYFSLLSYVDGEAWARLGITDSAMFISRYLRIESKTVLDTDLSTVTREVVVGFLNIPELREAIYRFAEFRTAEDVGLKLPQTKPDTIKVPMSAEQQEVHANGLAVYRELISDRSQGARNKALGILMQLSLIAVHPELVTARPDEGWSGKNWNRVSNPSAPKLEHCAEEVLSRPRCGHAIFLEAVGGHYFMREVLVRRGIPRERIAILNAQEAPTSLSRQVIAERFNGSAPIFDDNGNLEQEGEAPAYDVVIANSVAYEGIDLHIRTCVVHHLDLPWEPATLQQRNGRAVRQGNTQSVIAILYYIAQGSIDAARLTIILGKLTWMKDILQSAERETNNPAAGSELSQDELVMFLYSPDELATIRSQMAARKEAEDRRAARRRAWQIAKRMYEQSALSGGNPVEMGQSDHALRELSRQLHEIPPKTWTWHSLFLKALQDRARILFLDLRYRGGLDGQPDTAEEAGEDPLVTVPLWERAVFVSESVQFQVGAVTVDSVTLRFASSIEWVQVTPLALNASKKPQDVSLHLALRQATPAEFESSKWPSAIDQLGTEQGFEVALLKLKDGLSVLGMKNAPDEWRTKVWELWGKRVIERLPRSLLVPVEKGPLTLVVSALSPSTPQPLPWTESGFRQFVDRAKTTSLKWAELNQICGAWFERPFPKGVVRDEESTIAITLKDGVTTERHPALWIGNGLGVIQLDGRYSVTHLASGLAVRAFATKGKAQRFAEWLESLPLNWQAYRQSDITAGFARPSRIPAAGEWMEQQSRVPSLDEIGAYFEGL